MPPPEANGLKPISETYCLSAASLRFAGFHLFAAGNPAQQGKASGALCLLTLFGQANKVRRLTGRNPSVLIFKRIISEGERLIICCPVPLSSGIQKQNQNPGLGPRGKMTFYSSLVVQIMQKRAKNLIFDYPLIVVKVYPDRKNRLRAPQARAAKIPTSEDRCRCQ